MPGRTPRAWKVVRGTLRKAREPVSPAMPQAGTARPPAWLPRAERAVFRKLEAATQRTGTPTRSFELALAGAAIAAAQLERCTVVLAEKGDTYETTTTTGALKILPRPELQLRHTALRFLRSYLGELGLTPVAIGRIDRAAMPQGQDETSVRLVGQRRRTEEFFG